MADDEGVGRFAPERARNQQGVAQDRDLQVDVRLHPQIGAEIDPLFQGVRELDGEARLRLLVLDFHLDHPEVIEGSDLGASFDGRLDAERIGRDLEGDGAGARSAGDGTA